MFKYLYHFRSMMNFSTSEAPTALNGWGAGPTSNLIHSILNSQSFTVENPEFYAYKQIPADSLVPEICSKAQLKNKHLVITSLATLYNTPPSSILIIETHRFINDTLLRFYHNFIEKQGEPNEFLRFVRKNIPIHNPWASESPCLFYQTTVEKCITRNRISKQKAQALVDNLLACLFNRHDIIVDLANRQIYKRKACIKIETSLNKLRHIKEAHLFDSAALRKAMMDCIKTNNIPMDFNHEAAKIQYYDKVCSKFTTLNKETVVYNGAKYHPYAFDHNYAIIRLKNANQSLSFLLNCTMFAKKYIHKEDIGIGSVIEFYERKNDPERLMYHYLRCAADRVVDSAILYLNQPR